MRLGLLGFGLLAPGGSGLGVSPEKGGAPPRSFQAMPCSWIWYNPKDPRYLYRVRV